MIINVLYSWNIPILLRRRPTTSHFRWVPIIRCGTNCAEIIFVAEIFQSYVSEDPPPAYDGPGGLVYGHLDLNNTPPTVVPPEKGKGFRYYLNKILGIFGRKPGH